MSEIIYPLAKETINTEDIDALCDWLKTYPRLTKGAVTVEVEGKWASYIGTKHAVFNNSGSSANLLMIYAALMTGRIKNKKIVVPSVGWVTTIAPAIQFGLEPIMVGADPDTFGIDLDQLEDVCEPVQPSYTKEGQPRETAEETGARAPADRPLILAKQCTVLIEGVFFQIKYKGTQRKQ